MAAEEEVKAEPTEEPEERFAVWDGKEREILLKKKKIMSAGLRDLKVRLKEEQAKKHTKKAEATARELRELSAMLGLVNRDLEHSPLLRAIEEAGKKMRLLRQFAGVTPDAPMEEVGWRILDRIGKEADKYVRYPSEAARNAALLFAVATHGMSRWRVVPRLGLLSATPNVGKSTALELLVALSHNPVETLDMSVAVLFRIAEERQPTLFIDEVDHMFVRGRETEKSDGLTKILNAGFKKRGAVVQRMEKQGDDWVIKDYRIFVMAVVAGIQNGKSQLPSALMSRTIPIWMKAVKSRDLQKLRDEQVEKFELAGKFIGHWMEWVKERHTCDPYQVRTRFGIYGGKKVAILDTTPQRPNYDLLEMDDARHGDIWEPLFTVAYYAGGEWPERAKAAAEELTVKKSGRKPQKEQTIQFIELLAAYYIEAAKMMRESGLSNRALGIAVDGAWMIPTSAFIEAITQKPRDGENSNISPEIPVIDESPFEGQGKWITPHRISSDLGILDPKIETKRSKAPQRRGFSIRLFEEHWDQHVPGWRERLPEDWADITPGDDHLPGQEPPENNEEPLKKEEPRKGPKVKFGSLTADDIEATEDALKGLYTGGPDGEG